MEVALFNTVAKTLEGSGLVRMSTVDEDSGVLPFQGEAEVDVRAETVWNVHQTKLVKFVINLRKGVLKHVLLALKYS